MKKLIVVALLLPLVIVIDAEYEFGDIIAFRRQKCSCKEPIYFHYAIYVGTQHIDGKQPGQDIFHHSGQTKADATCQFGRLSDEPEHRKDNYRDTNYEINQTAILERIKEMTNQDNCRKYHLTKNNCEHLATYVRYGERLAEQRGTFGEGLKKCFFGGRKRSEPQYKISLDYKGVSCEELCKPEGSKKSGSKKSG